MATLTNLPREMIDTILSYSDISFEDIYNLRRVCKQLRYAAKSEKYCFLEKKFSQRWPTAKKYYDKLCKDNERRKLKKNHQKYKKRLGFIETGIYCVSELRCYNYTFRKLFKRLLMLKHDSKSMLHKEDFLEHISITYNTEKSVKLLIFMDEMKYLLTQLPRADCDLAERYCYTKLFDYLKMEQNKGTFKRFGEQKFLEQSATMLAQQLQFEKDVFYSNVKASLDNIALEVLNVLREKHPNHSIFSMPAERFSHWKENEIYDNYWREREAVQIIHVLKEYMFDILHFQVFYSKVNKLDYICIDYVLENKRGHQLLFYVIFQSVARRLGLRCDIVTRFGDDFNPLEIDPSKNSIQLFWIPNYTSLAIINYREYIVISQDRENIKDFYKKFNIPKMIGDWIKEDNIPIYEQTLAEMLENILEFELSYERYDLFDTNYLTVHSILRHYVPKTRPQGVKFSVGMIVTHGDQSTDCPTGVIIGWHQAINKKSKIILAISKNIMPLNICSNFNVTDTRQETHYIILTRNHKLCYVKEDDITLTQPTWIENIKIYYYFCKFAKTHYVPNDMLARVYPYDGATTAKTIFKN